MAEYQGANGLNEDLPMLAIHGSISNNNLDTGSLDNTG